MLNRLPESNIQVGLFEEKELPIRNHLRDCKYELVDSAKKLDDLVKLLGKAEAIAIDTETDSIVSMEANLVGISCAVREKEAFYIPVAHNDEGNLDQEMVLNRLLPILEDEKIKKVGHNLKYDYIVLARSGVRLAGIYFDTMIAAYLLNQNLRSPKLDDIAFSELGIEKIRIEELIGEGRSQVSFDKVKISDAYQYGCEDADVALRLYHHLVKDLPGRGQDRLFHEIEMPLVPVLARMEIAGIMIDDDILREISAGFEKRITKLEGEIYDSSGEEFNINSPLQLQKILFEKLNLQELIEDKKELKKLKTGGYSTGANELGKLFGTHEIIGKILEYRELTKLKSTYVDALPKLVNKKTERIHTSFNQAITATGGFLRVIRIFKIFPSGLRKARKFVAPLSPLREEFYCRLTIPKLN